MSAAFAEIYITAAEMLIDEDELYSCNAINKLTGDFSYQHPACLFYVDLFHDKENYYSLLQQLNASGCDRTELRALILCLAAEVARRP